MTEIEIGRGKRGQRAYSFDDIAVVPSRRTRDPEEVSIGWQIDAYHFDLPVMGAPMDSVMSPETAIAFGRHGGLPVLDLEGLWTRYEDPEEGWSIGVPPGYERSDRNGQVQFRDDAQRRTLRIEARAPRGAPLEVFQDFSRALEGTLRDYEQLRLEPTQYLGQPAADLEFTFYDTTTLHVLDRTFVDASGTQAYALYWQVHQAGWAEARPVFDQLLKTFRPRS